MNLPTKLTILRIFLIPLMLIFMLPLPFAAAEGWNTFLLGPGMLIALLIFSIASYTDFLDGHLARKHNMVTNMGKFLDPIADKILIVAVLIAFVERGRISTVIPVIVLTREFAVTGIRLLAANKGQVIAASKMGKLKTVTQIVAVIMIQLAMGTEIWLGSYTVWHVFNVLATIALWFSVLMTIVSGLDYYQKNKSVVH